MSDTNPKLLNDLMHRLQSLEVDLHEAARSRELSQADYNARIDRLRYAIEYAAKIKAMLHAPDQRISKVSQVDLPVMGDYSRLEQKIITRFVGQTKNHVAEIAKKADQVAEWSRDAAGMSTGWFRGMRRLSWLRLQINRAEQDIESIRRARAALEDFVGRSELGKAGKNSINQSDLISAFREFEMATDRVTALRARVRSETTRNNDMRNWLAQNSMNRRQRNPEKAPPEPKEVLAIAEGVFDRLTGGAKVANERLVVARQLIKAFKKPDLNNRLAEFEHPPGVSAKIFESSKEVATHERKDSHGGEVSSVSPAVKLSRKAKKKLKEARP